MATEPLYKLIGNLNFASISIDVEIGASGVITVVLDTATLLYPSDDATATDLIKWVNDTVQAADAAFSVFRMSIDANGLISFKVTSGTGTLTWTALGALLQTWSRFAGATVALTTTNNTGFRTHQYGFYPQFPVMDDSVSIDPVTSMSRAQGSDAVNFLVSGKMTNAFIESLFDGWHRSDVWTESADLEDLKLYWEKNKTRHYPDKTITNAFSRKTEPYGYRTFYLHKKSHGWDPRSFGDLGMTLFTDTLEMIPATA